jgi:hypothetical protein
VSHFTPVSPIALQFKYINLTKFYESKKRILKIEKKRCLKIPIAAVDPKSLNERFNRRIYFGRKILGKKNKN